jgi:uncharacterized integral membrane protein (TIGR00697 family)
MTHASPPHAIPEHPLRGRHYRYYDLVMVGFVTVLLASNFIGPGKTCQVALFGCVLKFGAGNLFFPISYIFDDVLTEVYGYARARKVIWAGFAAMIFFNGMAIAVMGLPAAQSEPYNQVLDPALRTVFGNSWRIVLASMAGFWAGDFVNSYVLAKMKLLTRGRWLWTRTIGSTILGEAIDSVVFYPIAFLGIWENQTLLSVLVTNWAIKVGVEVVFTPATYLVVNFLKRAEREDFYDVDTDFTPFSLRD